MNLLFELIKTSLSIFYRYPESKAVGAGGSNQKFKTTEPLRLQAGVSPSTETIDGRFIMELNC